MLLGIIWELRVILQNNLRRVVGNDLIDISLQIFSQMCFCLKGFAKIVRLFIVFGSKEH